jgi:membrane-bound metal-dependent hydrolase YbcI (DUF457 family)
MPTGSSEGILMSKKAVHVAFGVVTGGGAAALVAKKNNEEPLAFLLQTLGGIAGGYGGGVAPDLFEPPVWPGHRGIAHSVAAFAGGTTAIVKKGRDVFHAVRAQIREYEEALGVEEDPWRRFWLTLAIALGHLALGYSVGALAGYGSHLALDACTPGSLPLLLGK